MARRLVFPLVAAIAVGVVSLLPASATADPLRAHPYFQDSGTLDWSTTLDEATAAARSSGRLIFIEYGRKRCGNCKTIVERIIPAQGLKARMTALCVGLAAECDNPDPRVEALFAKWLPTATILPFCALVTADMRWVDGWAGLIGADDCARRVTVAEPVCARWRALAAATAPCASRGGNPTAAARPPAPPAFSAPTAPLVSSRPTPAARPSNPPAPAKRLPTAPTLSLGGPADGSDGCGDEGGDMECEGGVCRIVRRPVPPQAPVPAPAPLAQTPPPPAPAPARLAQAALTAAPAAKVAEAPATAPPAGLAIAPTAPRQARASAVTEADRTAAREILARAVSAAGRGAYGDVIRLHADAARLPVIAEPLVWNDLHSRAEAWVRNGVGSTAPSGPRPASTR